MPTPEPTDVSPPASATGSSDAPRGGEPERHIDPTWPRRGARIGRYLALDPLGAGAMGVIWRAYDPKLDRIVALKLVRGRAHPTARARLVREAQTLGRLSHDNVVAVFDVGTEGDEVFIAMEWIDGCDLAAWLDLSPRGWREVLAVMDAAGRGLQAAHDAGIVHRDFKPANVLVAKTGRIAVGDFGLARALADADESGDDGEPPHGDELTAVGTTVGTPAYMAPEQHRRASIDARADQYAWSVALYEGLYGTRPFAGTTQDELERRKAAGPPVPTAGRVPRRLWSIVQRGLSPDAALRYPSMRAMLVALRRAAEAPARRIRLGVAVTSVIGVALAITRPWAATPERCAGVDADADAVWSPTIRAAVHDAIARAPAVYAASTADHASVAVDRGIDEWRSARREACAATWIRREQSPATLDARMACLDRVLGRTAATIAVLEDVDGASVERVGELVAALPESARCDAPESDAIELPHDAAGLRLLRRLDDVNARLLAADRTVPTLLAALEPEIRERDDAGLRARFELAHGAWLDQSGDAEAAVVTLREAATLADGLGRRRNEAEAWIALVRASGRLRHVAEGRFYGEIVHALLATMTGADDLAADAALQLGVLAFMVGDDDAAAEHFAIALDLQERAHGPSHPRVGDVLAKAAGVELRRGSSQRAAAMLERAIEIFRAHYGEGHPKLATAMGNLGVVYAEQERWDDALATMTTASAMLEAAWGPGHPSVGIAADSIGDVLRRSGRPDEARVAFERARVLYEQAFGPDHPMVSSALLGIGQCAIDRGHPQEAVAPLERALRLAEPGTVSPVQRADIEFGLALALEAVDVARARQLAGSALAVYRDELRPNDDRLPEIDALMRRLPG